mmetsp:Transcript_17143/g.47015  ORF Transcript_17143/g.47015 Transcript_17143/m.47015 type:complete len:88 (-) Transcript_17143:482-745(-)
MTKGVSCSCDMHSPWISSPYRMTAEKESFRPWRRNSTTNARRLAIHCATNFILLRSLSLSIGFLQDNNQDDDDKPSAARISSALPPL